MKKALIFILAFSMLLSAFACSAAEEPAEDETNAPVLEQGEQEEEEEEILQEDRLPQMFSGLDFTPWDVEAALTATKEQPQKKYTIMVYLNGADLESDGGMATDDLVEMLEAEFDSSLINIVVLTGGTLSWQNEFVQSESNSIFTIEESELVHVADIGLFSMGNAGTLASFIDYGMAAFPAERYGLIFWNHGGGSIAGYGVDELFDEDGMTLAEIAYALYSSASKENNFEFIGFDACLMATVETAAIASGYAKYLIASEDLEPGGGWDYVWLKALSENPDMSGEELGTEIVETFTAYYKRSGDDTTLAVIDLAKIENVLEAMGTLMKACNAEFSPALFKKLSKSRNNTKTFGGGSPRDNDCDMIDVADMAEQLNALYPEEAEALKEAVSEAVLYYKNSRSVKDAYGLTTYYPFGGREGAKASVETYKALSLNADYTNYLVNFISILTGDVLEPMNVSNIQPTQTAGGDYVIKLSKEEYENLLEVYFTVWEQVEGEDDYFFMLGESSNVQISDDGTILTEFDGLWPGINGSFVCLYEISSSELGKKYAIPAQLNGKDVDIIAVFDEENPEGKILGCRPISDDPTAMAAKLLLPIKKGDKLKFFYYAEYFGENDIEDTEQWYEGDEFTVEGELALEWLSVEQGVNYLYGFLLTDYQGNTYYTDFIEVEFE